MEDNKGAAEVVEIKVGDKVKIVNYGQWMMVSKKNYQEQSDFFARFEAKAWHPLMFGVDATDEYLSTIKGEDKPKNIISEDENKWIIDRCPELVGREDVVVGISNSQGRVMYSLDKNGAWYSDNNLELCRS